VDRRCLREPELSPFQEAKKPFQIKKGGILALMVPQTRLRRDSVPSEPLAKEIKLGGLTLLGADDVRSILQDGLCQELAAIYPPVVAVEVILEAKVEGHDSHKIVLTPKTAGVRYYKDFLDRPASKRSAG
jgi:hypothetical protein